LFYGQDNHGGKKYRDKGKAVLPEFIQLAFERLSNIPGAFSLFQKISIVI
jgi:hypothetical protein